MQVFEATTADNGIRADIFISQHYPQFSRSSMASLFSSGHICIDRLTLKPSYNIRVGDLVSVNESILNQQPPAIVLPIIYEDDEVLVINKPAGILSHSKGAINLEASVASFIKPGLDKELVSNRAGIVHRLDRKTSGIIITGKNQKSLDWLQKQFSARKTKKQYLAIVEGIPEPPEAIIDAPITRNPKKPQTFMVSSAGKPSQTYYSLMKSFQKANKSYSILELKPQTGRTHQIRIHLAYINHPVVGDNVYGNDGPNLMLHARSLELTLPNRQRRVFSAPIPKYFEEFQAE